MNLDPFAKSSSNSSDHLNPKAKKDIFVKPKAGGGGGLGRTRKPEEALEPLDIPLDPVEPEPEKPKPTVILQNPKWEVEKVGFNEETVISVELKLPPEHAHKTKVTFELFAKTPQGPERMLQGEAHAEDGKAKCSVPIFIPKFKDAIGNSLRKVEYYFTAKHSESGPLDGSKAPKVVDEMAERLIESHILPDLTFATGKSFLHPNQAAALKDMCAKIKSWREKHPDGKLGVFGHADAVGKDAANKSLSERRAKSVFAFLMRDSAAWSDLDKEEKWSLADIQDLLKHLGHDPGASDGQDGPKTQAAVKAFQTKKSLPVDGQANAATRKALYQAFIDNGNTLSLKAKDFDDINGNPTAGCSEFNLVEKTEGPCETNRRVAVLLLKSNKNFPIRYPCAKGDVGACKAQVSKKGDRRTAGFGCFFYDELVVEKPNKGGETNPKGPIKNLRWEPKKAKCGEEVKLFGDSDLADGSELSIKISTIDQVCEEKKAAVKGGRLELLWKVRGVAHSFGDDGKPLAEVEVFADIEYQGTHFGPEKNLLVAKLVSSKSETFDHSFKWNGYSVHSVFQQKIEGDKQKVSVNKKVLKSWGGSYVKLVKAGIKGFGGGCPLKDHRWGRCPKNSMWPSEYWDGNSWLPIPETIVLTPNDFGALPLLKTGNIVHWAGSQSFIWPDPVEDYKYEDYASKRKVWINDSQKRWSGGFPIKRKACEAPKGALCCDYHIELEFTMTKVDTFDKDVICLSPGSLRSNAGLFFYDEPRIAVAAHEVGHLVGLPDEYETGAVDSNVNGDGALNGLDDTTLMGGSLEDESTCIIKKRHYKNFLSMARMLATNNGGADEEWVLEEKEKIK